MLEPWNNSSILPPPVNMFLSVKKIDISALKHVCNNIIKILSKQSPLHKESALCSRFLYKYDKKFRNDIGYRNFKKVHSALKKYLALNLLKDIESFRSALPSESDEKYLPTRQMLEYIMLRIIAFSKIMLRVSVCAKQAAIFYLNRLKRGESHWMSLLPYALLSRLWSITMVLVQHSTNWYSNLYPYLNKLELKGLPFLSENYKLPDDLEELLDLKHVDNMGRFDWDQKRITVEENGLLDNDGDKDLFDDILNFVNQSSKDESEEEELEKEFKTIDTCEQKSLIGVSSVTKIDQGEILARESYKADKGTVLSRESFKMDKGETLSRESFKILNNEHNNSKVNNQKSSKKTKVVKKSKEHLHTLVTNAVTLKEFIVKEEQYRNESDSRSLTEHLSLMQWHALKNSSLKLCDALTNRKIERKFQKLWKEKCLDYL